MNRRNFLKNTAIAVTGLALCSAIPKQTHTQQEVEKQTHPSSMECGVLYLTCSYTYTLTYKLRGSDKKKHYVKRKIGNKLKPVHVNRTKMLTMHRQRYSRAS